jgi:NAD(P)-dependent dehydrogenase (short-subunit alcohol dehydrogenase family)
VLLQSRTAVVYGGAGTVGRTVAGAFAREGAKVFLAGRTLATLEAVAGDIRAAGGEAESAQVDALNPEAVDAHADAIAKTTGRIDISFNAIGHDDIHGMPIVEMQFDDFVRPIEIAVKSQYLTARAAARHMSPRGSGVIMAITATTARLAVPEVGGTGVAFDAIESLCRQLAGELGPRGIRVAWLRTTGLPEALADIDLFPAYGTDSGGMTREELITWLKSKTMLNRLASLSEVGNMAAFLASDRASAITGCAMNLSCGSVAG